jgi:kumamolisin
MADSERYVLAGSDRGQPEGHTRLADVDPDEMATVTVYVRPRAGTPAPDEADGILTREEYAARFGASEEDFDAVRRFAEEHHLSPGAADRGRRSLILSGRLADLSEAFEANLGVYADPSGARNRMRLGPLTVPAGLGEVITGVFGLDQRAQARAQFRVGTAVTVQYTPVQIAEQYDFPPGVDGTGECIGLVELGGGYETADLSEYFSALGLAAPSVVTVSVDGGTNSPGTTGDADVEVMLDIEMAAAVAPGATVAVYFAPNTDQGFLDAVSTAVHDDTNRPSVISISWGGPESTWTSQAMNEMESAFAAGGTMGVTVTVASGDNGSTDGVSDGLQHVDFPASAPHALGCGGTSLSGTTEVVWNTPGDGAGGGGVSAQFPLPSYQTGAGVPVSANPGGQAGRGVPDVAGDADPNTGYSIRADGQDTVVGGTSAVAPLWAGLVARLNHALGSPVGFVHPNLYATPGSFRDITSGNNGAYQAGPGWDPCTGLGSPDGEAILTALQAPAPGT